jgi:hypothetical protein
MRWSDPSGLRGGGEITLFALACAIVLAIAFYGVNVGKTKQTASALPAENTHPLARIPVRIQREFHASRKMG